MQHRVIFLKYSASRMLAILLTIATSVAADSVALQSSSQYPSILVAGQTNPWALPEAQNETRNFRPLTNSQDKRFKYQQKTEGKFVTPEILDSIKQQQTQTQLMPGQQQYNQSLQNRAMPLQPGYSMPGQGYYGAPSYGMGMTNPLYDAPAVSPWGSAQGLIYRGQSLPGSLPGVDPLVPGAAMGGLPPIHVPSTNNNSYSNDVFNPFTFIPNRNGQ